MNSWVLSPKSALRFGGCCSGPRKGPLPGVSEGAFLEESRAIPAISTTILVAQCIRQLNLHLLSLKLGHLCPKLCSLKTNTSGCLNV